MWSCEISIDKKYDTEYNYILEKIKGCDYLSFAEEESMRRYYLYVASVCEKRDLAQELVENTVVDVLLNKIKLRYFIEKLAKEKLSHGLVALIGSIVYFDRKYEESIVRRNFLEVIDYNIDALLNFRLEDLTDNWEELAGLAVNLLKLAVTKQDIFDVATFLTSESATSNDILVYDGNKKNELFNSSRTETIEIEKIFDVEEFNVLIAVLRCKPEKLVVKNKVFSEAMLSTLRMISKILISEDVCVKKRPKYEK